MTASCWSAFTRGFPNTDKDLILATHGARKKNELGTESGVEQLELPAGQNAQTVALQMLLSGQLEFAEPNFLIAKDDVTPNDAQFTEQWALRNTGQNGGRSTTRLHTAPT